MRTAAGLWVEFWDKGIEGWGEAEFTQWLADIQVDALDGAKTACMAIRESYADAPRWMVADGCVDAVAKLANEGGKP